MEVFRSNSTHPVQFIRFSGLVVTSLIGMTGDKLVIGYYLAAAAIVSCIPVALSPRTHTSSQQPAPVALTE